MDTSDENKPILVNRSNSQSNLLQGKGGAGMDSRKFGASISRNRRALSVINQNLLGAKAYPCVVSKRALSSTNIDKSIPDAAHRPITRKFAAETAGKKRSFPEEIKKEKSSTESFTVWEDCTPIDADQPVPMSLETTEAMQEEKAETEEVEMEDIFEEPVIDIDSCDAKNPLAVVDYVEELYAYYRKVEITSGLSPNYMAEQFDITEKMRAILIDWLIEVHHKFELREETLFLTVNLIDRFLTKQGVVRKKLQLVGLVALLLACKYEEISVPIVNDLIIISDKAYSRKDILEMEKAMLNTLQFNMSVPTPYVFMKRFLKAAQSEQKLERLSFFLIELCLVEYEMLKFPPSFLAAAAIYTAQCSLYGIKQWSKTCEWHSNYSEDQLQECSKMIVGFHQKAATGRLTGVHRKYNTSKLGYAAKCEPANFLIDN